VNTQYAGLKNTNEVVTTDPDKYAILSSGGKDSLLTYGLVKEFGEAHPVFINESGRHWFTAVNAHKYYREHEPNTVKPWCNSDRVFNWMVRQMPFIREDYAQVRADIYPIRLWTVAVFLFGVLPVVRKRGIGNVLIGNEYDTTVKSNFQGISHYNGLYDQSKYFDNALSRYYHKKNWQIRQYSALRSLSELLILKVLVKRYPDLQREQVSCHAAHEKNGRMYPCGNCEKCRRIIGMLKALDEDPGRCGYTEEQIERALKALEAKSVKQIGSDAAHLYYLLLSKGLIAKNERTQKLAKPHPEILQLRFDQERSKLSDLPEGIRQPLFNIFQEYAEGAVMLEHGKPKPLTLDPAFFQQAYFLSKNNEQQQ
jgi:7-cyano-7-deazaguanine synthase in queuosine biosynthesis